MNTRFLTIGTKVEFRGVQYVITKVNPKNYIVSRLSDGKLYNLPRSVAMTVVEGEQDLAAVQAAVEQRASMQAARRGGDVNDENYGLRADGTPRFGIGTQVVITGRGAGRWEGQHGPVIKVNPTRYKVQTAMGIVGVPFSMARRTEAVVTTTQPQEAAPTAEHPLVGTTFRKVVADAKVLFKVTEVEGKYATIVAQPDPIKLPDGRVIPSDFEGREEAILVSEVEAIVNFEKQWAALTN